MSPEINIENKIISYEAQLAIDRPLWSVNLEPGRAFWGHSLVTTDIQESGIKNYAYIASKLPKSANIVFYTHGENYPTNTPDILGLANELPKLENPFSTIDEFLDNEEKVYLLTSHIRTSLIAPYGERLATRIESLFGVSLEEEPDGIGISAESLHHFLSFLQSAPKLDYPDVVLSLPGNIVAEWHVDSKHHFSVDFLPNEDVHFVIFKPNPLHTHKTDCFSGKTTADQLFEEMKKNNVLRWAVK